MTAPHPAAVGSFGAEVEEFAQWRTGLPLRWWQRLTLARTLEHDQAGQLVWLSWLLSTARQVGKSWLLRELFLWRIHQGERFGEPQLVLHTGKDLPVCREIQRPARAWARMHAGYTVRDSNGMEEIETADGSRWLIRGRGSVYGYSASLAGVDEAWKVDAEIVEDGIEPTMAERASAQLAIVSTAHRQATSLVPERRSAALDTLAEPTDALLLEWSAEPGAALDDRLAWRLASPHWSSRRERLVDARHLRAMAGGSDDPDEPDPIEAFRTQWLNIWPARRTSSADERIEPLTDEASWLALIDLAAAIPPGPLTIAIEDHFGRGAAVAATAKLDDGRLLLFGRAFARRIEARDFAALLAGEHPGSTLVAGATLLRDDAINAVPVAVIEPGTATTTRLGLPRLRELIDEHAIAHDGGADLRSQLLALRVARGINGLSIWQHSTRHDLARAAVWAVELAARTTAGVDEPAVF
jgi:hypothetical protein